MLRSDRDRHGTRLGGVSHSLNGVKKIEVLEGAGSVSQSTRWLIVVPDYVSSPAAIRRSSGLVFFTYDLVSISIKVDARS